MNDPTTIVNILKDASMNALVVGVFGLVAGYYLGKRNWKKQFLLKHFDLHEKILNKLNSIFEDEIEGYLFLKTNQEIENMLEKCSVPMSANEYFSELKKNEFFNKEGFGYPSFLVFGSIKDIISELRYLLSRSNNKISKIIERILSIWDSGIKQLDDDISDIADSFNRDPEGWYITKDENSYLAYLQREREELILLRIVPLINKLAVELKKYLKNKE